MNMSMKKVIQLVVRGTDMKELKLKIPMDFSEASVEQALMDIHNSDGTRPFMACEVTVSVYDASAAITMLIDSNTFGAIDKVSIVPSFRCGEWSLINHLTETRIKSGCDD